MYYSSSIQYYIEAAAIENRDRRFAPAGLMLSIYCDDIRSTI